MGFYTWILDANLSGNVMDEITYSSDSQRQSGFQSGTVASSVRVNTALRQSTLVTAALMESMNLGLFSYENSLPDVKSAIDGFFAELEVTPNPDMTGQTPTALSGLKIGSGYYTVSGGGGTSVSANPALVGTEANLTSIQIGATKYKCADPATVASNSSAILSQGGSLLSLQATVGGLQPTTGTGNLYSALESANVGTYTWYKLSKMLFIRIDTCTGTNVDMAYKLTDFPSTNFASSNCSFAYWDNMTVKTGHLNIYVSSGDVYLASHTDEIYARSAAKAIGTCITIILN